MSKFHLCCGVVGMTLGAAGVLGYFEAADPYMMILGQSMMLVSSAMGAGP